MAWLRGQKIGQLKNRAIKVTNATPRGVKKVLKPNGSRKFLANLTPPSMTPPEKSLPSLGSSNLEEGPTLPRV